MCMLSISQNTHIKNIISEQGNATADPRFLEFQYSLLWTWESRGPSLRVQSPDSHVFHT